MTPEAALTKLAVVLGDEQSVEVAADRMQLNLRGEQRRSVFHLHFGGGTAPEEGAVTLSPNDLWSTVWTVMTLPSLSGRCCE